jgi:peptidoglycan lytic transglycosylase
MRVRCADNRSARSDSPKIVAISQRRLGPRGINAVASAGLLVLSACSQGGSDPQLGVNASPRITTGQSVPKGGGIYKVGDPYKVAGRWYVPREDESYDRQGVASWYGSAFHGRRTANGEIYNMYALTAGHPTLPLPSYAYVTNLQNGRTILVRVNDRGPYVNDRIIDLSWRSARELHFTGRGLARVRVHYAGRAPLDGNDAAERRYLAAQSWHRNDLNVAQGKTSDIATGAIPENNTPSNWSVTAYRQRLSAETRSASDPQRSSVGGPQRSYIDVGAFSTRAEAERMRHEVTELGPTEIDSEGTEAEPVFRVQIGPLDAIAAESVADRVRSLGTARSGVARE